MILEVEGVSKLLYMRRVSLEKHQRYGISKTSEVARVVGRKLEYVLSRKKENSKKEGLDNSVTCC